MASSTYSLVKCWETAMEPPTIRATTAVVPASRIPIADFNDDGKLDLAQWTPVYFTHQDRPFRLLSVYNWRWGWHLWHTD